MTKIEKSIAQVSQEGLKLREFLTLQAKGSFLDYESIQQETGVEMNIQGKSLLRTALHFLKIEYTAIPGKGIELFSATNSVGILTGKFVKVSNSIKRAGRTQKNIQSQLLDELSDDDRKIVIRTGAAFALMHHLAKEGSELLAKKSISNYKVFQLPDI